VATVKGTLGTISGYARTITDLGLRIIVALVVVDVLFPASSGITENIGTLVNQFGENGLAGLIAVLLFLLLYKNR